MRRVAALIPFAALAAVPAAAATLDEAMAAALAGNPAVAQADAGVAAARARVAQADGARFPTATLSGSVGAGRLDPNGYFGLQAADVTPRAAMAALDQPLFTGGRLQAGREAAREHWAAAQAEAVSTRARLQVAVADAWATLAVSGREVAMRTRQLAQMREITRQSQLRFKAGDAPSTDLSQARAREAEAEAGLEAARATREAAAARFTALTGLAPEADGIIPPPPDGPADRPSAIAAALAGNPALAARAGAARAAGAQARAARAERFPTLGAFTEASTVRDQFFPDYAADQAVVGVRARWTLFDGSRQGRIAEASAEASAARAAEDQARRETEAEAIAAFEQLGATRRMVEAATRRQAAAAEALRSTRLEVQTGMKPQLALLDAEREALDAAVALARAEGGLLVAGWHLKAVTGG